MKKTMETIDGIESDEEKCCVGSQPDLPKVIQDANKALKKLDEKLDEIRQLGNAKNLTGLKKLIKEVNALIKGNK